MKLAIRHNDAELALTTNFLDVEFSASLSNILWSVLAFAPIVILILAAFLFTNQDVAVMTGAK